MGFQIHTSGGGPLSTWGSGRSDFYGVSGIPDVWVDGTLEQLGTMGSDEADYNSMLGMATDRWAAPTDVTLELYAAPTGETTYRISAIVGIEAGGEGKTFNLHLAQALASFPDSADGRYNNGIIQGFDPIELTLSPGQSGTVFQDITFDETSWDLKEDIRIIGFVQDVASYAPAEVHQAAIIPYPFPQLILCPADINGDGTVDVLDLLEVLGNWGGSGDADITGDGVVDVLDLLEVLGSWGPCPVDPQGACCMWDGTCEDMTFYDCMMTGPAEWLEGEECGAFECPELPTGACCLGIECLGTLTEYQCTVEGGLWHEGEDCDEYECKLVYCESSSSNCDYEYINHVTCGTIDNPSQCGYYEDFTALSTVMYPEQPIEIVVTNQEYWVTDLVTVWVDWNHDGFFDGPNEEFAFGDQGPVTTGEIIPPVDALLGDTRMRVTLQYGGQIDPCGFFTYGEVEDYTVTVMPGSKR